MIQWPNFSKTNLDSHYTSNYKYLVNTILTSLSLTKIFLKFWLCLKLTSEFLFRVLILGILSFFFFLTFFEKYHYQTRPVHAAQQARVPWHVRCYSNKMTDKIKMARRWNTKCCETLYKLLEDQANVDQINYVFFSNNSLQDSRWNSINMRGNSNLRLYQFELPLGKRVATRAAWQPKQRVKDRVNSPVLAEGETITLFVRQLYTITVSQN